MNIEAARRQMVDQQVRAWEVLDEQVLRILSEVPRERFVPDQYKELAFADAPIPIGHQQCMLSPQVQGRMLQALDLQPDEEVLEIGTGTGFLTACLAKLSGSVTSIEIHEDFSEAARRRLAELDIGNVELRAEDATKMTAQDRRFDAIIVTASQAQPDPVYREMLATGGRLLVLVGVDPVVEARLIKRVDEDEWLGESLFETQAPALINAPVGRHFEF